LHKQPTRLTVWRNTINLFHKSNKFVGPFRKAGFEKFRIDSKFLTWQESEERKPDIVSSSENGTLVIEITLNPDVKSTQLESYKDIDTQSLGSYGLPSHDIDPDVICSRLEYVDDGNYCVITVKDRFKVYKPEFLHNEVLKRTLLEAQKANLNLMKLPTMYFTLVPEMASKSREIRYGIFDGVMQIFAPNSKGKTVEDLVCAGLERIENHISEHGKKELQRATKEQMEFLRTKFLSDYLVVKDGVYQKSSKFTDRASTLGAINRKLFEWVTIDQSTLAKYLKDQPDSTVVARGSSQTHSTSSQASLPPFATKRRAR
jgi:hypothetical protein